MGQHIRDKVLRRTSILAISFFVSAFLGMSTSQSVAALPLGSGEVIRVAVKPISRLLEADNKKATKSTTSRAPSNATTNSQSDTYQPSTTSNTYEDPAPLAEMASEPLQAVAPIDTAIIPQRIPQVVSGLSFSRPSLPKVTLAKMVTTSRTPIQATEEGWKVFGITWYWWLLVAAGVGYSTRQLISVWQQRMLARSKITE